MMKIGNHISSSKGFEAMGKQALKLGASTFAFFTRNPRGGAAKTIDPEDALKLRRLMEERHMDAYPRRCLVRSFDFVTCENTTLLGAACAVLM